MDDDGSSPYVDLVKVAYANDSPEGQMIAGLLESAGIECLQLIGFQGTQIARPAAAGERGGGPRRVMVRADQADRAKDLLAERNMGERGFEPL